MEVTVTKLRQNGRKLSPAELVDAERVHGFLAIEYWVLKDGHGPERTIKELILKASPLATSRPLLSLKNPDQTRLAGVDMVYTGVETIDRQEYPQAWWVRLDIRKTDNGLRR